MFAGPNGNSSGSIEEVDELCEVELNVIVDLVKNVVCGPVTSMDVIDKECEVELGPEDVDPEEGRD